MAALKMTLEKKAMAYVLNKELGYTLVQIAKIMEVSHSTVSYAIMNFEYQITVNDYRKMIEETREKLKVEGFDKGK